MQDIFAKFKTVEPHLPIFLTGFMGVGKTTVGQLLAAKLNRPFVDTDQKLEETLGLAAGNYLRRFGEEAFRRRETRILALLLDAGPSVIATGGGVILSQWNRKRMLAKGWVVWLHAPAAVLSRRLSTAPENRPLLGLPNTSPSKKENTKSWTKLLWQRLPLYEECHYKIDTSFKKPEQVMEEIVTVYAARMDSQNRV